MSEKIYIVEADRGDYSDRSQYAVCWFAKKEDAEACALRMSQASNEWRSRIASAAKPWDLALVAQAEIGDPYWGHYDETDYTAVELPQGATP